MQCLKLCLFTQENKHESHDLCVEKKNTNTIGHWVKTRFKNKTTAITKNNLFLPNKAKVTISSPSWQASLRRSWSLPRASELSAPNPGSPFLQPSRQESQCPWLAKFESLFRQLVFPENTLLMET